MNFKEKAQSLTKKQVVELLIDAVRNPAINLGFGNFGYVKGGVCYGDAAMNAVCKLAGVVFDTDSIGLRKQAELLEVDYKFLTIFYLSIDCLRRGNIKLYNSYAVRIGIAWLNTPDFPLPALRNETYLENLHYYEKLAEFQGE